MRGWLVVAVLLLPLAHAGADAATFDLVSRGRLDASGAFAPETGTLVVDLGALAVDGALYSFSWESARGRQVWNNWTALDTALPGGTLRERSGGWAAPVEWGLDPDARIACGPRCHVLLFAPAATATVGGAWDVAPLDETQLVCPDMCENDANSWMHETPAGTPVWRPRASGTIDFEGPARLFFTDARVGGADALTRETNAGEEAAAHARVYVNAFVEVELSGARFSGSAPWSSEAISGVFDGELGFEDATGMVASGGASGDIHHAPVALAGRFDLAFGRADPEGILGAAPMRAWGSGEASDIGWGTTRLSYGAAPRPVEVSAIVAGVAWAALLSSLAAIAFYSRIARGQVMRNANRARVFDAVRGSPASAREVARTLGLSRAVVEHHLRMLEAHKLVLWRKSGASKTWFCEGDAPPASQAHAWALLRDETRRRVATLLAGGRANVTSDEVRHELGISLRLANYHLRLLCEAGLASSTGFPKRYVAAPALGAVLASSEERNEWT